MPISTCNDALSLTEAEIEHYRQQWATSLCTDFFSGTRNARSPGRGGPSDAARADLIATENIRCRWQPHVQTQECLFECFDPVIDISPVW